jgi:DNA polymerase III epsilon subunit-like protein
VTDRSKTYKRSLTPEASFYVTMPVMHLTPYESKNLIFIDTEFSSLDPAVGEIMSIGIVKLNGDELYLEIEHHGPTSKWVSKNIAHTLTGPKVSRQEAVKQVRTFLGRSNPFAIAYVDNYDALYSVKLFGEGSKIPFKWMTIDFASILFAHGINPTKFLAQGSGAKAFYRSIGIQIDKYQQHHALHDARLLRDVWVKLTAA